MISKRLKTIASMIGNVKTVADVGCDHGYLIVEAFLNHNISKAIAIDNKKMPLEKALNNIKSYDFYTNVRFSLSSGIEDLTEEVDAIVISGMGGLLIIDILETGFKNIRNAKLIIQANRNVFDVRKYLCERNYQITEEKIVFEDDKYYEIVVFEKTNNQIDYTFDDYTFGPILRKEKSELFINKLKNDLRILENIDFLTPENEEKINNIRMYL